MNEELLKEVLSDSKFTTSLLELETAEEVQAALQEKGVEITLADIETIKNMLMKQTEGELSDEELENVAGGSLTILTALAIASIITAACGGAVKLGDSVNKWTSGRW